MKFLCVNCSNCVRTSSRVGDIISAPNPSCGPQLLRCKISRTGIRKHKVLPLPVRAAPRMSLPLSETGRLFACTSVISTKKAFFRPGSAFEKRSGASTNCPNLSLFDSISEDQKRLSSHLGQSGSVNNNTRVQQKYHARIARRPALGPQSVAFLPIASLSRIEEGREISVHFLISFSGLKGPEWDPWEKDEVGNYRAVKSTRVRLRDIGPLPQHLGQAALARVWPRLSA